VVKRYFIIFGLMCLLVLNYFYGYASPDCTSSEAGASCENTWNYPIYKNNAEALLGGLKISQVYRLGGDPDLLAVVHEAIEPVGEFPSSPILDSFNISPISNNWTICPFTNNYPRQVLNGKMIGTISDQSNQMYWSKEKFGPNMEVSVTLSTLPMISNFIYLYSSFDFSTLSGYEMIVTFSNPNTTIKSTLFYKWTNGSLAYLGGTIGGSITPGDKIGFQNINNILKGWIYHNGVWSELGQVVDNTYNWIGYIGLGTFDTSTQFDDVRGGTR
jgi:hypothetical protein